MIELLGAVMVALLLLLAGHTLLQRLSSSEAELPTAPLNVGQMATGAPPMTPEQLTTIQQAAIGADWAPMQQRAAEAEAVKLEKEARAREEQELLLAEDAALDPEAEMRRRMIQERLRALARAKPGLVAALVRSWIAERR